MKKICCECNRQITTKLYFKKEDNYYHYSCVPSNDDYYYIMSKINLGPCCEICQQEDNDNTITEYIRYENKFYHRHCALKTVLSQNYEYTKHETKIRFFNEIQNHKFILEIIYLLFGLMFFYTNKELIISTLCYTIYFYRNKLHLNIDNFLKNISLEFFIYLLMVIYSLLSYNKIWLLIYVRLIISFAESCLHYLFHINHNNL